MDPRYERDPWARLLAYVTGLINQELLLKNEYLAAENRLLRAYLPARLRLSDPEFFDQTGIVIKNPLERRTIKLANGNTVSKSDLQDCLDEVADILNSVYTPEASREDLAGGIGDALDVIEGNAPGDDTDADDSDDDTDLG